MNECMADADGCCDDVDNATDALASLSHVIMMGDLNFRINDLTAQEIYDRITEGSETSRQILLQKDQVSYDRRRC